MIAASAQPPVRLPTAMPSSRIAIWLPRDGRGRVFHRDRVLAGTDCGFAQGPFVRRVHPSIQWAKLQSLTAGAALASRALGYKA